MSRWRAAAIHLLISVLVVVTLGALLFTLWYPYGLFQFANADRLLLIVAVVDVVAGPLLTLIVFKANKPKLGLDLSIIGLVQAALLAYGLSVVWQSRPVFLVALPERIVLVFANEILDDALPASGQLPRSGLPWFGPELVGARLPDDPKVKQYLLDELIAGRDLPMFPQHYVPFTDIASELLAGSDPAPTGSQGSSPEHAEARMVPITSSRGNAQLLIRPRNGEPIEVITP